MGRYGALQSTKIAGLRRLVTGRYARNVTTLLSGSAASQLVNLASYPIVARLYSPHDFGAFALFIAVTAVLGAVSCGRFDLAIQFAKSAERFAAYRLSQLINIAFSVSATVAYGLYEILSGGSFGIMAALLIGAATFLTGFCNATALLLLKVEAFRARSTSVIIRTLVTAACQILLSAMVPGSAGLALGFCAGFLAQAIALGVAAKRTGWRRTPARRMRAVLHKYWKRVAIDVPSTVLSAVVFNIMSALLFLLFTREAAGNYAMAFRIAVLPIAVIATAMSEVFFQRAARSFHTTGGFWKELKLNVMISTVIAFVVVIPIVVIAKYGVTIYLGPQWASTGDIIAILSPMIISRFVCLTVQNSAHILGKPRWLLVSNTGQLIAIACAFGVASSVELSLFEYLGLSSVLLASVYIAFVAFIVFRVRRAQAGGVDR